MSPEDIAKVIRENNHSPLSNEMLMCLMWQESGFDPDVENDGARGLIKIRERQALAQVNKTKGPFSWKDLFDAAINTAVGTYYLDWFLAGQGTWIQIFRIDMEPSKATLVAKMRQCEKCLQEICSAEGDGLCCTSRKPDEMPPSRGAATPLRPRVQYSGAQAA